MINTDIVNMLIIDRSHIAQAISTGAAWEIWQQVELVVLLRLRGDSAAREVPYPAPFAAQSLDVLAGDANGSYAIELKVESATNAGAALLPAAQQDMVKIQNYQAPNLQARWVVAIAYSGVARNALNQFAQVAANNAIYQEADSVGVLVATR